MLDLVRPMDAETLRRLLRYGFATALHRIHLRPGCRPFAEGMGGPRELGYRQLSRDDTDAVAGHFLAASRVSEKARTAELDAARELFLFLELPEGGLAEATLQPCPGGLAVTLDLYEPLPAADRALLVEP